jgi:hypothetical protein
MVCRARWQVKGPTVPVCCAHTWRSSNQTSKPHRKVGEGPLSSSFPAGAVGLPKESFTVWPKRPHWKANIACEVMRKVEIGLKAAMGPG